MLTARILTVCNSSTYAAHNSAEITNIRLAIARLGLNEACNIIFHSRAPELGGSAFNKTEIRHVWFHSQALFVQLQAEIDRLKLSFPDLFALKD